jgi:hypothetical protein
VRATPAPLFSSTAAPDPIPAAVLDSSPLPDLPGRWAAVGRVLVACEFSGRVRDAFAAAGHDAVSCDLLPSETPGRHHQGDVRQLLGDGWDLMVAHPPCTHLAYSGARWFAQRRQEQADAVAFVVELLAAPIPRIAVENPNGVLNRYIRRPDQVIEPYHYGHGERKATCLWLANLPKLQPTDRVDGREPATYLAPRRADRWKTRSRTYPGIAAAMAAQWGPVLT